MRDETRDKVTAPAVRAAKGGPKLRMITAYDAPSARIADDAGADIILVGDSVANVVLGRETTLTVTVDDMVHHTKAVSGTAPAALVVGDMPWMSYHVSIEDTVRNAGRLVREGGAEAVKLEGGRKRLPMIEAVLDAEIPVMGHVGLTPQSVHAMGGYRVQGKQVEAARALMADARALDEAGVFSIVLEGVPDVLAELITKEVGAPTIGIGAGAKVDGQVLVFHDLLGLGRGRLPKFVRQYADLSGIATEAVARWFEDVQKGDFPSDAETYHMPEEVARALLSDELHEE
ncbi:MAG TPA: 3-methyl-2-oxobutanoate hydroxymethyltransferase [Acidimicrobiia bacterium]|nr:3-methyl-2-oxobutanoate hydroxymethyltransferase [Acidimicrobiia bacterium]